MTKAKQNHLIIEDKGHGHLCRCLNCGGERLIGFPAKMDEYLDLAQGFRKRHKDCLPPKEVAS